MAGTDSIALRIHSTTKGARFTLKTARLGEIHLDPVSLAVDLAMIDEMTGNDAYSRYNMIVDPRKAGKWTQSMLDNWSGNASDGGSKEYEGHFQWTAEGLKVPYIRKVVETTFHCDHLKSVRIFLATNAIISAHKDYMEFKKGFRRLHIPLRTSGSCVNSEGAVVYHMEVGGIYFLDGH